MGATHQARVLVVEDVASFRDAVCTALRVAGLDVVHAVGRGEDAMPALARAPVDVALIDLGLPGISGVETVRRLHDAHPQLPILVLTVFEDPATIVGAIQAGAQGYMLKGDGLDELMRAVHDVSRGLAPLSPAVARHLIDLIRTRPRAREPLSAREREVLTLLVDGKSYGAVAEILGIGVGTVQTHVKSVYRKLNVTSKAQAAVVAVASGLVKH